MLPLRGSWQREALTEGVGARHGPPPPPPARPPPPPGGGRAEGPPPAPSTALRAVPLPRRGRIG